MPANVSVLEGIDNIVREDLMFVERQQEPRVDGIFSKMYDSSEGVVRGGGRGGSNSDATGAFQVLHTFATGVAGAFRNLAAGGDDMLNTDNTGQSYMYGALANLEAWPGIDETTAPGYVQKTITLVEGLGIFALPLHLALAEELDATIAKPVALTVKGTAKKVAQSEAIAMYAEENSAGATVRTPTALATLVDITSSAVTGETGATMTLTFTGNSAEITGRIGRFYPGMLVDVISDAVDASRLPASNQGIVSKVDYVGRSVDLKTTAAGNWTGVANGDMVVLANSSDLTGNVSYGPSGFETWLVSSGTPFGLSITTHPQFKSVVAAVNNVLDQAVLDTYVGSFFDAYADMCDLDSFITTAGVLNNYIENTDGLWRYERQGGGGALKMKEGWSSFDYEHNGRAFEVMTSRYIKNGTLYGMKLGDQNLKRYVPPRVSGTSTKSEFSPEIQWYAPLTGSSSIFLPAYNTSAKIVRYLQAPFFCQREVCPEQLQGIKLTGLTELFV